MKTRLKTIHEEEYSDKSRVLGVLLNYDENDTFKESFIYIFNHDRAMYVFFNTMVDMIDYLIWNDSKIKRAYMEEKDFDWLYDNELDGKFIDKLTWSQK
jgi:hypothetical protein